MGKVRYANQCCQDLIIEVNQKIYALEVKSSDKVQEKMFKNLISFENLTKRDVTKIVIFQGELAQNFGKHGMAYPYKQFLAEILPEL